MATAAATVEKRLSTLAQDADFGSYDPKGRLPPKRAPARVEPDSPTMDQSRAFQSQFDYFNREIIKPLLGVLLPPVMLTFSGRSQGDGFCSRRWLREGGWRHEIALRPNALSGSSPIDTASAIVHGMVHLWQHEHGRPGRRGYHNTEWAAALEALGLVGTATGALGGPKTGQSMSHLVVPEGRFAAAFATMPAEYYLPWLAAAATAPAARRSRNKTAFACPKCGESAWGRPRLQILCGACMVPFLVRA